MSTLISFSQNFFETLWTWILPSIFKIILILVIAFFTQHLTNLAVFNFIRQSRRFKRAETLSQITRSTSKVIISVIALMMILHELGLDIRPILASAGILGVAFSLGAQSLMKDIINGFFILLEDQFGIGDSVRIGEYSGTVEKMNLRTTTVRDSQNQIHIFPNGEIKQVTVVRKVQ